MSARALLTELRARGVALSAAAGCLHVEAPRGVITPELRAALTAHKAELLAALNPPRDGGRLDLADCLDLIRDAFEAVEAEYVAGALALLDADPDLAARLKATEAAIDAAVKAGPTESELRAALTAHVGLIREACQRRRAQCEAAADAMPELADDATAAVGFRYATGGAWVSEKRAPGTKP